MSGLDTRAIDGRELEKRSFPKVQYGFRIFISEEAFDRATERGQSDLTREVGGVLVGRVLKDEKGPFLSVETTIDALHAEEKGTELTFTQETWNHINREMDEKYSGKKMVGWYHTHPGFGVFLSDRDLFIHQSFFNLPFQIALVYDPKSHEHGVFSWRDNEPARCRQYWVGETETNWDGARIAVELQPPPKGAKQDSKQDSEKSEMSRNRDAEAPPAREWDWITLSTMALAVLLVGAVAGFWFAEYRMRDVLRETQMRIDRDRAAAAEVLLRGLNVELLSFVREAAGGGDAFRRRFDEGLLAIDRGLVELSDADSRGARVPIVEGRRKLKELRDSHYDADRSLKRLEALGTQTRGVPRELMRLLAEQRAALGQLYAEVAQDVADNGDIPRARRLLQLAATSDPGNARRYEEQRRALREEGSP